jgi:hypothetical protein
MAYILVTSEGKNYFIKIIYNLGIPMKFHGISKQEAVKYTGLVYDLVLFAKKSLDDLKKGDHRVDHSKEKNPQFSMRLRLKHGVEIIIIQGIKYII